MVNLEGCTCLRFVIEMYYTSSALLKRVVATALSLHNQVMVR